MRRSRCRSTCPFFGLGSDYRPHLFDQIFDLMYYGKMGFTYKELYNLPVWLRRYYYLKLADVKTKERKAEEDAYSKASKK
jgi:hypothetical protein